MKELWDESLLLYSQGQLDEALVRMLAIETRVPSNGHLLANIGVVYRDKGELAMAETYLRRACMAIPDDPSARFNLALTLLRAGRLREGFREYECRWRIPQFQQQHLKLALPVWQGEPLTGQRVLLYGEQGAGDTLQFARYAPLVRAAGGDVRMVVRPDLQRLMTWMEEAILSTACSSAICNVP
jgi:tetratricopeptide (TPR) repeat protein